MLESKSKCQVQEYQKKRKIAQISQCECVCVCACWCQCDCCIIASVKMCYRSLSLSLSLSLCSFELTWKILLIRIETMEIVWLKKNSIYCNKASILFQIYKVQCLWPKIRKEGQLEKKMLFLLLVQSILFSWYFATSNSLDRVYLHRHSLSVAWK